MKIFYAAWNYPTHNNTRAHALYNKVAPTLFLKTDSSLLKPGKPFFVPDHMGRIDFGAEVVVRICRLGKNIPERFAHRYYDAATLGIDFTARDLLTEARQMGLPWDVAKGFDGAAVIGEWVEKEQLPDLNALPFRLDVNGQTLQEGRTQDMICNIDQLIAHISRFFTLKTGDLLYTGAPAESLPASIGDTMEGYLNNRHVLTLRCK